MSEWISNRLPLTEDGATIQFLGPTTAATEDHRDGARQFVVVDAGYLDYRARCWMSLPPTDENLPPMCTPNPTFEIHDE